MTLFLLIGLAFLSMAVILIARAVVRPQAREARPVERIDRYGFTREKHAGEVVGSFFDGLTKRLGTVGRSPERDAQARAALMSAGMYTVTTTKFNAYRTIAAIAFPLLWLWFGSTTGFATLLLIVGTPAAAWFGWMTPLLIVRDRGKRRLAQIEYELPELIDLLVVTVEAGLGFVGSLQLAAGRIRGPLGQELRLAVQEQSMGLSANEALENMLGRCDTPSMRSFVRSVIQGETLGVSIGQILRDLAREMRRKRKANAEERAQKAPIKILFPLVFMIFPAMFIVLLGPAVFALIDALKGGI